MTAGSVAVPTIIPLKVIGGRKYTIDTTTPIELKSATEDATVFYTLDGYRPNPFNLKRLGEPSTFVYKAPLTLPVGKTTIRAIALLEDGCCSSCVTKTFVVLETDHSGAGDVVSEVGQGKQAAAIVSLSHQQSQRIQDADPPGIKSSVNLMSTTSVPNSPSSSSVADAPLSSSPPRGQGVSHSKGEDVHQSRDQEAPPSVDKHVYGDQYTDDSCSNCWMPYSEDTKYKFCPNCGHPLSQVPQGPTMNLSQARDSVSMHQSGSSVTSEGLIPRPSLPCFYPAALASTMHPILGGSHVICSTCGQTNAPGIRFCDWCGCRSNVPSVSVPCQSCLTPLDSCWRYCHCCGAVVKAPPPRQSSSLNKITVGTQVDVITEAPPTVTQAVGLTSKQLSISTQTEGPFDPDQPGCEKAVLTKKSSMGTSARNKVVSLRAYSPGKGLWRVQLEHILSHLKAYTQSSDGFQANIGDQEMGKLLHASAATTEDTNELCMKLTFALKHAENKDPTGVSAPSEGLADGCIKKPHKEKLRPKTSDTRILVTDQLVTELSSPHEAKCDIIQRLLEQGAIANTLSGSGVPVLILAVSSGCLRCIETLVKGGALPSAQTKCSGNSALHEAVMQGPQAKSCIELLIRLGADPQAKNRLGQSPCELASHLGHKELVRLFASHVAGQLIRAEMGSLRLHT